MPLKFKLSLALLIAACPGDPYQPCQTVQDCDPVVADACATQGGKSWCTKLCKTNSDCPEGPDGELPICRDIGKAKVCSLP